MDNRFMFFIFITVFTVLGTSLVSGATSDIVDNVLAYYDFENNALDESANGFNLTDLCGSSPSYSTTTNIVTGNYSKYTSSVFGPSVNTDIRITNDVFTMDFWFQKTGSDFQGANIVSFGNATKDRALYLSHNAGVFYLAVQSEVSTGTCTVNDFSYDNDQHHWVVVVNTSSIKVWQDGVNVQNMSGCDVTTSVFDELIISGSTQTCATSTWAKGWTDNFLISEYVYTETDVEFSYNSSNGVDWGVLLAEPPVNDTTTPSITNNTNITGTTYTTITITANESVNISIPYGTTITLSDGVETSATYQSPHIVNITGLTPSRFYYYNVTICDENGNCLTDGPFGFQTNNTPQPVILTNTNVTGLNDANITVTTDIDSNISISYGTTNTLIDGTESSSVSDTSHIINITGLSQSTDYFYNVTICGTEGNCSINGPFGFTTKTPDSGLLLSVITPSVAYTDDRLTGSCNSTIFDAQNYHYNWYKDDVFYSTGENLTSATNSTQQVTYINATDTTKGDVWKFECSYSSTYGGEVVLDDFDEPDGVVTESNQNAQGYNYSTSSTHCSYVSGAMFCGSGEKNDLAFFDAVYPVTNISFDAKMSADDNSVVLFGDMNVDFTFNGPSDYNIEVPPLGSYNINKNQWYHINILLDHTNKIANWSVDGNFVSSENHGVLANGSYEIYTFSGGIYVDNLTITSPGETRADAGLNSTPVTILGTAPITTVSVILKDVAFTTTNINASCEGYDADDDNLSFYYKYYKNDVELVSGLIENDASSFIPDYNYSAGVGEYPGPVSNFFLNETTSCDNYSIRATWDHNDSTTIWFYAVDLQKNGVSYPSTYNINPSTCGSTCSYDLPIYDADITGNTTVSPNDVFTVEIVQFITGPASGTGNELKLTLQDYVCSSVELSSSNYVKDDEIIFGCLANDGSSNASWLNSSTLTISNTPPEQSSFYPSAGIRPDELFSNTTMEGLCKGYDDDGDVLKYDYRWYKNDVLNKTGTTTEYYTHDTTVNVDNITGLIAGDTWKIECRANDSINVTGFSVGVGISNGLTVSNIPSTINDFYISPTYPKDTDTLACNFNVTDDDPTDELNVTIQWYKNETGPWLRVALYDYTFVNVTKDALYSTGVGTGSVTENLGNYTWWMCEIIVADSWQNSTGNSTVVKVHPLEKLSVSSPDNGIIIGHDLDADVYVIDYDEGITCSLNLLGTLNVSTADEIGDSGVWNVVQGAAFAYDNDFDTYAVDNSAVLPSYFYFNYTIPKGDLDVLWEVKDTAGRTNITIPDECLTGTKLELQVTSAFSTNEGFWQCRNATGLKTLRNEALSRQIYEEQIHWNVYNQSSVISGVNTSFIINPLRNGNYSWNVNCTSTSTDDVLTSDTRWFYYDIDGPIITNELDDSSVFFPQIEDSITITGDVQDFATVDDCWLQVRTSPIGGFSSVFTDSINATSGTFSLPYIITTVNNKTNPNVSWRVTCNDSFNNIKISPVYNFTVVDGVFPALSDNNINNFFSPDNQTVITGYLYGGNLNITFADHNLFQAFVNITCEISGPVYYWEILDINTSTYTHIDTVNFTGLPLQKCTVVYGASDSHTKNKINRYKTVELDHGYRYTTEEGITTQIIAETDKSNIDKIKTKKENDRYTFDFEFEDEVLERDFLINSDKEIYVIEDSEYPGHMVVWNPELKQGNWIDFSDNDIPTEATVETIVEEISSNQVRVTVRPKIDQEKVKYKPGKEPKIIEKTKLVKIPKGQTKDKETGKDKEKETGKDKGKDIIVEPVEPISNVPEGYEEITVYEKEKVSFTSENIENYDELLDKYGKKDYKFKSIGGTNIVNVSYSFYIGGAAHFNTTNIYDNGTFNNVSCDITTVSGYPLINETQHIVGEEGYFGNLTNGTYNFVCYNDRFLDKTYSITIPNGTGLVNETYASSQGQLNVIVRNIKSEFFLADANVTITLNKSGIPGKSVFVEGNDTQYHTFFVNATTYTVSAAREGYEPRSVNVDVDYHDNVTVILDLSFIANLLFFDERTSEPFNISGVNRFEFQLVCENRTTVTLINSTSANITIDCNYKKFNFKLFYSDIAGVDSYNRPYILEPDEALNYSIYLIDLQTTQYIYNEFIIDDLLSRFDEPRLQINKYIGDEFVQIMSDRVDGEQKVPAWLIENDQYELFLYSDNQPVIDLSFYIAAIEGTKNLRLYETGVYPEPSGFLQDVFFTQTTINNTQYYPNRTAVLTYTDKANLTERVTWTLREGSSSGAIIHQTQIEPTEGRFEALYPISEQYENSTLVGTTTIWYDGTRYESSNYIQDVREVGIELINLLELDSGFLDWFFTIMLGVLALMATLRSANIVSIGILSFAVLFSVFGWYGAGNAVLNGILAFALLISLLVFFKERSKAP